MLKTCKRYWVLLAAAFLAAACVTTPPEQDPVVQRLTELDGRLLRIERILSNQSLLEQSQRVDALFNELRTSCAPCADKSNSCSTRRIPRATSSASSTPIWTVACRLWKRGQLPQLHPCRPRL
jgi:hypothetical protein